MAESMESKLLKPKVEIPPETKKEGGLNIEKNPENRKKTWKETVNQKFKLGVSTLKENLKRLRGIREIEKKSGISTDKCEGEIIKEIKNISEEIKTVAPKKDYKKEKTAEKKEKNKKKENVGKISFEAEGSPADIIIKNAQTLFFIDSFKDMLIKNASQKKYLEKLTLEFNGDKQKAIKEQAKRIKNIKNVNIVVFDNEKKFQQKLEELKNNGLKMNGNIEEFKGVYVDDYIKNTQTIYSLRDNSFLAHEIFHSETRGEKDITENARKLLKKSYLKQGLFNIFSDKNDEYFSHVAERLEGKKGLEFCLDKLGIKKYGDPFTEKHYNDMMKAYDEGKIQGDARFFIERTHKDYFKDILDTIALNENQEKTSVV